MFAYIIYIIFAIILAASFTSIIFVLIGKIEHRGRKVNLNWLLLMATIILYCILAMVLIYHGQHDKEAVKASYNQGVEDGKSSATHTYPTNEEVEEWFSSTQRVTVSSNDGGDTAIHIINKDGDEWVLIAD